MLIPDSRGTVGFSIVLMSDITASNDREMAEYVSMATDDGT